MKPSLRIFFVHWGIFITYFIATSLKFVYERSPNPIGFGILMWLCMLVHIAAGGYRILSHRKTMSNQRIVIQVMALLSPILLFLLFSTQVYDLLWKWRGD